jgi:hypothetical protein
VLRYLSELTEAETATVLSWSHTDPQSGVEYVSSAMALPGGTPICEQFMVGTPIDSGARWRHTNLDPVQRLYAVSGNIGTQGPTIADDIQQIKQQLHSGRATVDGTATVDGQRTIKLTMPAQEGGWTSTLYVDAQTYAPVKSFAESHGGAPDPAAGADTTTEKWLPANPGEHRRRSAGADPGRLHAGLPDHAGESQPGRSVTQEPG